jgi:hypothetical protein
LLGREKIGASRIFEKCLEIFSTENSYAWKNLLGKTRGMPKTASAVESPVSSLGWERSPRRTQGFPQAK